MSIINSAICRALGLKPGDYGECKYGGGGGGAGAFAAAIVAEARAAEALEPAADGAAARRSHSCACSRAARAGLGTITKIPLA